MLRRLEQKRKDIKKLAEKAIRVNLKRTGLFPSPVEITGYIQDAERFYGKIERLDL